MDRDRGNEDAVEGWVRFGELQQEQCWNSSSTCSSANAAVTWERAPGRSGTLEDVDLPLGWRNVRGSGTASAAASRVVDAPHTVCEQHASPEARGARRAACSRVARLRGLGPDPLRLRTSLRALARGRLPTRLRQVRSWSWILWCRRGLGTPPVEQWRCDSSVPLSRLRHEHEALIEPAVGCEDPRWAIGRLMTCWRVGFRLGESSSWRRHCRSGRAFVSTSISES